MFNVLTLLLELPTIHIPARPDPAAIALLALARPVLILTPPLATPVGRPRQSRTDYVSDKDEDTSSDELSPDIEPVP